MEKLIRFCLFFFDDPLLLSFNASQLCHWLPSIVRPVCLASLCVYLCGEKKAAKYIVSSRPHKCTQEMKECHTIASISYISATHSVKMWQGINKTTQIGRSQQCIFDVICQASGLSKAYHQEANKPALS